MGYDRLGSGPLVVVVSGNFIEGLMPAAAGGEPAGLAVYLDSIAETARQLHAAACSRPPGATGQRR
jgi:hypothetical protein